MSGAASDAISRGLKRRGRPNAAELVFWLVAFGSLFVLRERHLLLSDATIFGLFALSLDLILGYAGILSLGQAAFFGLGAYTAGLLAKHGMGEPLLGLVAAAGVAGFVGLIASTLVLRGADLTRLMVTLGVALIFGEIANQASWLSGGADGLQGVTIDPLFGLFDFDLYGTTAYAYSLGTTFVLFVVARKLVGSPFGMSLRAIRDNPLRARAIGIPVNRRLATIYMISAAYAGVAGALLAQTNQFVSLEVFSFARSADVLLVLVIGGVGYLYGGLIGAVVFKILQEVLSGLTPQYWQFWIGLILIVLVLAGGRERITDRLRHGAKRLFGRGLQPLPSASVREG